MKNAVFEEAIDNTKETIAKIITLQTLFSGALNRELMEYFNMERERAIHVLEMYKTIENPYKS